MHQIDRNTGDIDRKQSAPAELIYAHKQCRRVHDPAVDHKGDQKAIYGQLRAVLSAVSAVGRGYRIKIR